MFKKFKLSRNSNSGFTLIELLVVVVIIGILSTLLTANFIGVRQRARDGQRKADLRQIQASLELYRSDMGAYPTELPECGSSLTGGSPPNTYMQKIPCDPGGESYYNSGQYFYVLDDPVYTMAACLENSNDQEAQATSPGGTGTCESGAYFVVQSP